MEKIQALTEKILHEGVEKGQAEAARIIEEAKQKAEQIVADARTEAQSIVALAQKKLAELDTNTKSELANVVTNQVVSQAVDSLAVDKDFLGQFALSLAQKWVQDEPIVISTPEADSLKAYFAAKAKDLLDKGVTIKQVNGKDTFFTIAPADGSYKVNFGKEEFETYFKGFLRPQLVEMLF